MLSVAAFALKFDNIIGIVLGNFIRNKAKGR